MDESGKQVSYQEIQEDKATPVAKFAGRGALELQQSLVGARSGGWLDPVMGILDVLELKQEGGHVREVGLVAVNVIVQKRIGKRDRGSPEQRRSLAVTAARRL
jgi:hypothetical protein